jgi:hypothetical protein
VHFLDYINEKCDRISDGRLLLSFVEAESQATFLNQVIQISATRSSTLNQAAPQGGQLP